MPSKILGVKQLLIALLLICFASGAYATDYTIAFCQADADSDYVGNGSVYQNFQMCGVGAVTLGFCENPDPAYGVNTCTNYVAPTGAKDNCPTVSNSNQLDTDGDGVGDVCDNATYDNDGDGFNNAIDNCPAIVNADQLNTDGDAKGDVCDTDDDNDGVLDVNDAFPLDPAASIDTDGDGKPNDVNTNMESNVFFDSFESAGFITGWSQGGNGSPWFVTSGSAADGSYYAKANTNGGNFFIPNQQYLQYSVSLARAGNVSFSVSGVFNSDLGDLMFYVDGVKKKDWVSYTGTYPWASSTFPLTAGTHVLKWIIYSSGTTVSLNLDAVRVTQTTALIADTDDDGDTLPDVSDNCPINSNLNQLNTDGDAQGDVCDNDDDNDGVADSPDRFPLNVAASSDDDLDGFPGSWNAACNTACQSASGLVLDNCPSTKNVDQLNTDGDAQGNACDTDDDNDGVVDTSDAFPLNASYTTDADKDGLPDNWESAHGYNPALADYAIATYGASHQCSITKGRVQCSGDNTYGQINVPAGITTARALVLGATYSCAITDSSNVCWGQSSPTGTLTPVYTNSIKYTGSGGQVYCYLQNWNSWPSIAYSAAAQTITAISNRYDNAPCGLFDYKYFYTRGSIRLMTINNPVYLGFGVVSPLCALTEFGAECFGGATMPGVFDPDGDGVAGTTDQFPLDATQSGVDTDGDTIDNAIDADDDNDGVLDVDDAFPLDATESVDTDGDGIGNNADTDDDGDGVPDIGDADPLNAAVLCAAGNFWNGSACAVLTTCSANEFESTAPTTTSDRMCSVRKQNDFNADGKADLLLRNTTTGDWSLAQLNGLSVLNQSTVGAFSDIENKIVSTADFNGDGTADILTRGTDNGLFPGAFHVDLTNGATVTGSAWLFTMSIDLNDEVMSTKDFNKDGKADVLLRNSATGVWKINYMNGTSDPTTSTLNASTDICYTMKGDGDYDGNGYPDILLRKDNCGGAAYPWLINTTDGDTTILASGVPTGVSMNMGWAAVVTDKDFNGDGKSDVLIRAMSGSVQQWLLYDMNGAGAPSASGLLNLAVQSMWQFAADADFNGDGKADIVLRSIDTGQWYGYLLDNTTIVTPGVVNMVINPIWTLQSIDDNNGDSKADILLRNSASGQWWLYLMNGLTVQSSGVLPITSDLNYVLQND